MPYFGRDWRDPGCVWMKVGCSRWEAKEKNVGVMLDSIPRWALRVCVVQVYVIVYYNTCATVSLMFFCYFAIIF